MTDNNKVYVIFYDPLECGSPTGVLLSEGCYISYEAAQARADKLTGEYWPPHYTVRDLDIKG